jgi:hypothetical protein
VSALDAEVALAAGYALFLLAVAAGLDLLARHSHRRSERYRTAGFSYHPHLDAWECPEGEHLWLHEHDHERRLLRYRGRPQVCNTCPRKPACTDSDEGREIVRFLADWPQLEAGRFHRGLSAMLVALAALIVVVALVRHHAPAELVALGSLLLLTAAVGRHLAPPFGQRYARRMKRHPALIPLSHDYHHGLVQARRLRRAAARDAPERHDAASAFLSVFARNTRQHFLTKRSASSRCSSAPTTRRPSCSPGRSSSISASTHS